MCSGANISIQWKMKFSNQLSSSLNRTFHLSPHKNQISDNYVMLIVIFHFMRSNLRHHFLKLINHFKCVRFNLLAIIGNFFFMHCFIYFCEKQVAAAVPLLFRYAASHLDMLRHIYHNLFFSTWHYSFRRMLCWHCVVIESSKMW